METEYDIGQKVFYVCKEYSRGENKVFEGFVKYINIWSESNIEYGMSKELGGEYHKSVHGYAIGLTESEAVRKHFTHNAKEHLKKANELLSVAESGKLKNGYTHGTTGELRSDGHINDDQSMYNGIPPWAR